MIENYLFYPIAAAAILIFGISKSGFGSGLGVLAVPMMALLIPPIKAAGILIPLQKSHEYFTNRNTVRLITTILIFTCLTTELFRFPDAMCDTVLENPNNAFPLTSERIYCIMLCIRHL